MWIFNFYEITVNKLFFGYQIFIRQISHITPNNHYFGLFRQEKGPSYSPVILTFGGGAALNKSAHYGYERALKTQQNDVQNDHGHSIAIWWWWFVLRLRKIEKDEMSKQKYPILSNELNTTI